MGLNKKISKLFIISVITFISIIGSLWVMDYFQIKNIFLAGFIIQTTITLLRLFAFRGRFRIGFSYIFWILTQTFLYSITLGNSLILQTILISAASIILGYIRLDKIILRTFNELGYIKTNHPPKWVIRAINNVKWMGVPGEFVVLKGKHFKYKIICVGNQGHNFEFYKRKR
jgi:hypothetical protein